MNLFENMGNANRGEEVKPLIAKWSKTGLMEGLKSGAEKSTVAVLLENQAKQLVKEGSGTTAGAGAAGFEQWTEDYPDDPDGNRRDFGWRRFN